MSDLAAFQSPLFTAGSDPARPVGRATALTFTYVWTLLLVAVATLLAFIAENVFAAPNLTLIYVLPVVIAAAAFGWGQAAAATVAGVLAFDFFFAPPYFSLQIYSSSDLWAATLLLATAGIVASIASLARRRAVEAARAAEQAEALQDLAHLVIVKRPTQEVLDAAATALQRIFRAPAVVFLEEAPLLRRAAAAGAPRIAPADEEAARGAIAAQLHTRAASYPFDRAEFEFWPVSTPSGACYALGVDFLHGEAERPERPERFFEAIAAYLAAAVAGETAAQPVGAGPPPDGR
jgi:two-component system sensor histidine kinase KdpD